MINLEIKKTKTCGHQDQLEDPNMDRNTKLQELQTNRDASGLRLKDSKRHVEEMEKMLHILEEVQVTKRLGDKKLQKTEEAALTLTRKVKSLEKILNERPCPVHCLHNINAEKGFTKESEVQQNKNQLPLHPLIEENPEVNKEESVENLIACIGQEMAVLSDILYSSTSSSVNLIGKLDILKKLIEKWIFLHESQVIELKKIVSSQEQKFSFQEEKAQTLRQEFKDNLKDKTVYSDHQQDGTEAETCLQGLLDRSTQGGKKSHELLSEKRVDLELEQQESEQHMVSEGEAQQHAAQYSCTSLNLHQQNILLSEQLNNLKLEFVHLKTELNHYKLSLAALEHQKSKLQASEVEHVCHVEEEILAKQQLSIKLENQGLQLQTLTEEHKELQLLYSCKIKESEGVVLQLQNHLKQAQTELDQVKCTLRTLKQKDDHGFEVVQSLLKEITTRRQQIDSMKRKIQHLEETKEKLCQELDYRNLENKHQLQELTLVQTEKKQLAKELETVKLRDKHLRERIIELEATIFQLSGNFASCQELIQLQEQEYYRLKLEHVMDLKQVRPSPDLGSPFGAEHGFISKKHRLHSTRSVRRRWPALEKVQSTEFSCDKTEEVDCIQRRRKHSGSKSHHLLTNELQHILICQEPHASTPAATTTSPQVSGRRSPVHMLLTSNPNN